jgi:glutaredoxin
LKGEATYSTDAHHPANLETIPAARAKEIIDMNRRGEKPLTLGGKQGAVPVVEVDYQNVVGQDDLTRFDKKKNKNNQGNRPGRGHDRKHHHNKGNEKKYSDTNS